VASSTVVNPGASGTVSAGGIVCGNQVNGGVQTVFGTASNTLLLSGADEIVSSGGVASGTTVSSGSVQAVSSGGLAVSTIVRSGGLFGELAGGVQSAATISSGGEELVLPGGVAKFHLANDGAGGTMVTDPPLSSGQSVAAPGP
jgi:fibronectin-binding autotransporter adhesin